MTNREEYEDREKEFLAPYAQASNASLGRKYAEKECIFRSTFQRDLARIIHSSAFRRLEHKTQVFIDREGKQHRTRLTHSLEVSQIAKGVARILHLNEDLAQTIALAHDLGHTPFGHPGEDALDKLMKSDGGFEHNLQSYRVVTRLEDCYADFKGLNLSYEVLEGIIKHTTSYDKPSPDKDFKDVGFPTLEAQIVNVADEIAFMTHDMDDSFQSGMLNLNNMRDVSLWNDIFLETKDKFPTASEQVLKHRTVSGIINILITDLQDESRKRIRENVIKTLEDVRLKGKNIISLSEEMQKKASEIKKYLLENIYLHPKVLKMSNNARGVVTEIFNFYLKDPESLPEYLCSNSDDNNVKRRVCDFIAGMTDPSAMKEFRKIQKVV